MRARLLTQAVLWFGIGLGALAGCVGPRAVASVVPPRGTPVRPGWLLYRQARLYIEAPSTWIATEREEALRITDPSGRGRLEVSVFPRLYADAKACLAAGETSLKRGEKDLTRVRRHASRIAGMPAVAQEADSGPWHGWAWAACDGGRQYRISFSAQSTASPEVLEVYRALLKARRGGES